MKALYLIVPLAPLVGAIIAGFLGWLIGRRATHRVTILCMIVSFAASCLVLQDVLKGNTFNGPLYTWITSGGASFHIGFLIDPLSALMMVVVTFVSLVVHIYTIGYMDDDPGYQRFFSYISLFTFSMLMLVMANNFLQLFFGWEAVGLISYLLIGFWYTRPTRDLRQPEGVPGQPRRRLRLPAGHRAGAGATLGSLEYAEVFKAAPGWRADDRDLPGTPMAR